MKTKKRIPIIAALLSFFAPGVGQIYNGHLIKGMLFVFIDIFLPVILFGVGLPGQFSGLIAVLLILLSYWIFVIGDALRGARKREEYVLKPYNRLYLYLLVIAIVNCTIFLPTKFVTEKILGFGTHKISTGSMEPALLARDFIISDTAYFKKNEVQRGDLVIFRYPLDPSKDFLKRVIALEGDKIEIRDKRVYIDDDPVIEDYEVLADETIIKAEPRDNFGPEVVPAGHCFVLGDNRDNSSDSRLWRYLPIENVKGKPLYIYWAKDKKRIGMILK